MGRARKNRRSHTDRKTNTSNPRNILDRDDDYTMHDVGHSNLASSNRRRGRKDKNNRRARNWQNENDGTPNNDDSLDPYVNPFLKSDMNKSTQDGQGTRFQQSRRNQKTSCSWDYQSSTGADDYDAHHYKHDNGQRSNQQYQDWHQDGPNTASRISQDGSNPNQNQNHPKHRNSRKNNPSRQWAATPRSTSPARRARFCTECSTVRRANLTLRDWLSSAAVRASEVVDRWSDEVGVSRGSGDEMDWQPEPVVRVLILGGGPVENGWVGASTQQQQQQQQQQQHQYINTLGPMKGGAVPDYVTGTGRSQWELRPGALNLGVPGGNSSDSIWDNDDSTIGATQLGSVASLGQGAVGQEQLSTPEYSNSSFGVEFSKMMMISPPETPPY